jgi:hypothetical protein
MAMYSKTGVLDVLDGQFLMDSSSRTGPHGHVLMDIMDRSSWTDPHSPPLSLFLSSPLDTSSWTDPHGQILMGRSSWTNYRFATLLR